MKKINVKKNSKINTINQALELIDEGGTIYIYPGIYQEKIKVKKNNLKIYGLDPEKTIIIHNDYALKIHKDGKEYNTFRTYTMLLAANNIHLKNLQIVNNSGSGKIYGQAVALATYGDNIKIENCILDAFQDTLFLGPLPLDLRIRYQDFLPDDELRPLTNARVLIENSTILGDVDFIFGCANAFFENCDIISKGGGYVTAPATDKEQEYGLTFYFCRFTSMDDKPHSFLARPWRDYGKAVFIDCIYGNHIYEEGFNKWNDSNRDKTCRFYELNCHYHNHKNYERVSFGKKLQESDRNTYLKNNTLKARG